MLSLPRLKQSIGPIFDSATMPTDDPVGSWCRAYSEYAGDAAAGPVVLSSRLIYTATPAGSFLDSLDAALRAMWMSAVWIGSGVTAVTSVVPPVQPLIAALASSLLLSYDREYGHTLVASALHTYTLSIVVTVMPPSGTPIVVTLT